MIKRKLRVLYQFLPFGIRNFLEFNLNKRNRNKIIQRWEVMEKSIPVPHQVKQLAIEHYQSEYKCKILVETGTYLGDMVLAQKNNFERIISIELGIDLWKKAVKRFSSWPHIQILQGDSGKVLNDVVIKLDSQAIFWLDGHYSGDITAKGEKGSPIFEELEAIFKGKDLHHIILIDDARCFNGKGDYPTIQTLEEFISAKKLNYNLLVKDDIIRIVKS
jgi:hypothetical protein